MFHAYLEQSNAKPLPVVIIGNGPSGICLSYLLSGNIPYVRRNSVHPNPILQRKLEETPEVPIVDQDLDYLSEGLEGRSSSPVALLFDALLRPDTDFGGTAESVLTWWHEPDRAIPHLVLGKTLPGGAWHSIEGSMFTLSQGDWMGLPDVPFKDWLTRKKRGFRNNRATAGDIVQYYQYYVAKKGLMKNFLCGTLVTSVKRLNLDSEDSYGGQDAKDSSSVWDLSQRPQESRDSLFQVDGFITNINGTHPFSVYAENVVLATGTYDSPTQLGVQGEHLPFIHHTLSALEEAVKNKEIGIMSDPILIVGAGLTAADAILFAHHYNIPVIHAFRRRVDDPALIFNQLPKTMYPEYHKVHQMMREQANPYPGPYEHYVSLPEHHVACFLEDRKCIFSDKNGRQQIHQISMAFVLIGSNPNLSYLPSNGMDLAVDCEQPVSSKRNPIDVDLFTYESVHEKGLYAIGPLAGDNFVRFVQGGALAIASSMLKKFKELHQAGKDLMMRDPTGQTVLHHAVKSGSKEIVKYIIENAPAEILDVAEEENGETSLHQAAALRQRTICHYIVEAGASLMKTDLQGDTPKHRAEKANDPDLAAYLENRQHYQMIQREDQETAV